MRIRSRLIIFLFCFSQVFSTAFTNSRVISAPSADSYINVSVKNIKIQAPVTDFDGTDEFRFFIVASDDVGNSARLACPGKNPVTVRQGSVISPCGYFSLSFNERNAPDQVYILLLGVDEDSSGVIGEISTEAILTALSYALGKGLDIFLSKSNVVGWGLKLAGFGFDTLFSYVTGKVREWFLEQDVIGSQVIVLRRSENWSIQKDTLIQTDDKGLTVTLTIDRSSTAPNPPPSTSSASPAVNPSSPTTPQGSSAPKVVSSTGQNKVLLINNIKYPTWKHCSIISPIQIGDFAYVNPVPPLANFLRAEPKKGATIIGKIPYGENYRIKILDGPECDNGWVWWYVRYKGNEGWTAEGDEYWLLPILEER